MQKFLNDNLNRIITKIILIVLLIVIVVGGALDGIFANAELSYTENNYTEVLDDLQSDENFSISEYPADSSNYSLYIIQIAESSDNELFIYVYQPSFALMSLTALQISMSLYEWNTEDTSYSLYDLTLLSSKGVFQKYLVKSFAVSDESVRYYDIATIYRAFNADIDENADEDNTVTSTAVEVGKCWSAVTSDGVTYYDCQATETVTITASHVGKLRSYYGSSGSTVYLDSHYLAFSTDWDIEALYEADVTYVTQSYYKKVTTYGLVPVTDAETYGEEVTVTDTLTDADSVSYEGFGFLGLFYRRTYSWDRIMTASDFLASDSVTLDDDVEEKISGMQYVLRFAETFYEYSYTYGYNTSVEYYNDTLISDVTILRLKFLSDGDVYNLGTVMNKVTGSDEPDGTDSGTSTGCNDYTSLIRQLLMIAALVLLCVLFAPILPYVAKFIVWVISLPFKLINAIVQAVKKRSDKPKKE